MRTKPSAGSLADADLPTIRASFQNVAANANGVLFAGSEIRVADVSDGTSNTYLVGEKYLPPDNYDNGADDGDNECMYIGDDWDIHRYTVSYYGPPLQDRPGYSNCCIFGSAHSDGFNMAMCDGSVHVISYSIDAEIHRCLGNRNDGKALSASAF